VNKNFSLALYVKFCRMWSCNSMDLRQIMNWVLISAHRKSKKNFKARWQMELTVLFLSRHFIFGGHLRFG
jgi:hypothetical protein